MGDSLCVTSVVMCHVAGWSISSTLRFLDGSEASESGCLQGGLSVCSLTSILKAVPLKDMRFTSSVKRIKQLSAGKLGGVQCCYSEIDKIPLLSSYTCSET